MESLPPEVEGRARLAAQGAWCLLWASSEPSSSGLAP